MFVVVRFPTSLTSLKSTFIWFASSSCVCVCAPLLDFARLKIEKVHSTGKRRLSSAPSSYMAMPSNKRSSARLPKSRSAKIRSLCLSGTMPALSVH